MLMNRFLVPGTELRMRRYRYAPKFIVLPLLLSVGVVSWAMLLASLLIVAMVVLGPAYNAMQTARRQRNDLQATLGLVNEKIALQRRFLKKATTDPRLMRRLADRQLDIINPNEQVLPLGAPARPRSVQSLIDDALVPVNPKPVVPPPWWMRMVLVPAIRIPLIVIALVSMAASFLLEISRHPRSERM
jgi:hypothetical protein